MKKKILFTLICLASLTATAATLKATDPSDVFGYWMIMSSDKRGPDGIAYVYRYEDRVHARLITIVNPKTLDVSHWGQPQLKSSNLVGEPYIEGLDIIWDATWNPEKNRYDHGKITELAKNGVFKAELWREDTNHLRVRGGLGLIYKNFYWTKASVTDLPIGCPPVKEPLSPPVIPQKK